MLVLVTFLCHRMPCTSQSQTAQPLRRALSKTQGATARKTQETDGECDRVSPTKNADYLPYWSAAFQILFYFVTLKFSAQAVAKRIHRIQSITEFGSICMPHVIWNNVARADIYGYPLHKNAEVVHRAHEPFCLILGGQCEQPPKSLMLWSRISRWSVIL